MGLGAKTLLASLEVLLNADPANHLAYAAISALDKLH